jgi:hypothetical protein
VGVGTTESDLNPIDPKALELTLSSRMINRSKLYSRGPWPLVTGRSDLDDSLDLRFELPKPVANCSKLTEDLVLHGGHVLFDFRFASPPA